MTVFSQARMIMFYQVMKFHTVRIENTITISIAFTVSTDNLFFSFVRKELIWENSLSILAFVPGMQQKNSTIFFKNFNSFTPRLLNNSYQIPPVYFALIFSFSVITFF
jgi:hypothetical protein